MIRARQFYTLVPVLILWIFSQNARGDDFGYYPLSSMHLGGGYDPKSPTSPFVRPCIAYTGETNIDSQGGTASATYSLLEVTVARICTAHLASMRL
jgi:hypothetical protein